MNKMFKLLISIILMNFVSAKELSRKLHVMSIKKDSKENYLVLFQENSAIYITQKKHIKCLKRSIRERKEVLVTWDMQNLKVTECK